MTKNDHLTYFARLLILEKLLLPSQKSLMSGVFKDLIKFYFYLIKSKSNFDISNLTYEVINSTSDSQLKKTLKNYSKKEVVRIIFWLKKVYHFEHIVNYSSNNIQYTFSNKDLTLNIIKENICCSFVIKNGLLKYLSYDISKISTIIYESIEFSTDKLDVFVSNMDNCYFLDKSLLDIIFYS